MLSKNIYLLYPPGYSGSYLHWCIHKSEADLSATTIDDPVNKTNNTKFGGLGTAHLHQRIPTHQSIINHMQWMVYNQPQEKKVFLINCHNIPNSYGVSRIESAIATILGADPDPVFVVIKDNGDSDIQKYGSLNTITKWPIFFKANQQIEERFKFDSFNCKDSIEARNLFVEQYSNIFPTLEGVNSNALSNIMKWNREWYNVRNTHNGHEVNEDTYIVPPNNVPNLFQILATDITAPNFANWLDEFFAAANAGTFDTNFVRNYHSTYVSAQQNLQWFDDIKQFRINFKLTDFLRSHSLAQAFVIMEVKEFLPTEYEWQTKSIDEIVKCALLTRIKQVQHAAM